MISRKASLKSKADRAKSNACSPSRHGPHGPSMAAAGNPHCGQHGGFTGDSFDQHAGHAAPQRRSRTWAPQRTHETGKRRFRIASIIAPLEVDAKGETSLALAPSVSHAILRRFP